MPEDIDPLYARVRTILPEIAIEQFEINREGLSNEIAIVNRQLVCRFARDEHSAAVLQNEMRLLDFIRPQLAVQIPDPIRRGPDYMVYPLLVGENLRRTRVLTFSPVVQSKLARQLGSFLHRLHNLDVSQVGWEIPTTRAPNQRQNWLDIQARLKAKVYPLLMKAQIAWVEDLLAGALGDPAFFEYPAALIHGDLASYHILYDAQEQRISAVIDFGVAGLGDPATDIGGLINFYGESFARKIQPAYPDLEQLLPRARFYAQAIELQWVLLGLETGDPFWFTAHIGGARDIQG